ncbi:LysR family transcriptional regulator [Acidaminococcus fermentans]|jgi:DNA-binding transcriptional LysR family regulator|uniref:LysR family transcriptional regulator n=1 Tax=Acidaminococcus fermentans TaxID=905 RepID=UPI002432A625|nr:LysR family transcriptional regulator [Acidaminococcus fermentans]MCI6286624.1 LysR family transcriptional regulator [Acidaminococcus fermentans]
MDFGTLHSFVVLAEELGFAKAAKKEHTSQSTLSRRIQSLENELGVQLFHRDTRNIELTEAGKEFYFQANKLLEQYHLAVGLTKKAVEGYTRKLRIGIGYYEQFFLLPFIGRFAREHKDVQIDLYQFIYETLLEHFIRGNLDIILTSDQFLSSISEEAYVKQLLWEKDWSLILSRDNPLSAYPYLDRKQLRGQSIITMYNGSVDMIRRVYHNQAFVEPFKTITRVNSFSGKLTLVAANMGIGFIPSFAEVSSYKNICIRKLVPAYTPRKFYILCKAQAYDHTLSDFFTMCRAAAQEITR